MKQLIFLLLLLCNISFGQRVIGIISSTTNNTVINVQNVVTTPASVGTVITTSGYSIPGIGAAQYLVRDSLYGATLDTTFTISMDNGNYAHLIVDSEIELSKLGMIQGNLKNLYPNYTEVQRHAIRKANFRILKKAVNYCRNKGITIQVGGGRYELYLEDGNGIVVNNNDNITIKGKGEFATELWIYPAESRYSEDVFTVSNGVSASLRVESISLYGFNRGFETYSAILNFGGDTTKVKLIAASLRTGLASTLAEPGRQIYLSYENGYRVKRYTISSYDTINKIVTLGARDMSGTQPTVWETAADTGHIAIHWIADLPTDTVATYNKFWESPQGITYFVSSVHSTLPAGNNDTCYYFFKSVRTEGFYGFQSSIWGNEYIQYDDCTLQAQGGVLSRFSGVNNLWAGGVKMNNCILERTGTLNIGATNQSTDGVPDVWHGSGTYLHPNVPVEYNNCTFRDNLAVATRNYSASLYATQFLYPAGAKVVARNSKWINNGDQYHYHGSSVLPVEFYDCYFDNSNVVNVQRNATFTNCVLDGTPVNSYSYGASAEPGYGFSTTFNNCTLLEHHYTNSLAQTIIYNNCYVTPRTNNHTFVVGTNTFLNNVRVGKNMNIDPLAYGVFHSTSAASPGYLEINNCYFDSTNVPLFRRLDGLGIPGRFVIKNSTFKTYFNNGIAASQNQNGNYLMEIINSEFPNSSIHTTPNISDRNKLFDKRDIVTKTPTTGTVSYEFPCNWGTSAKNLTLSINANHYNVSGGAIDRIVLGNASNNSQYNDIVYLTAVGDFWFTKYDSVSNPLSNIMFSDTIYRGETVALKIDPTTILHVGTSADSYVLGTGNGTLKSFSYTAPSMVGIVAESATIVSEGKTYTDNGRGRFVDEYGAICGYIDYISKFYRIVLIDAPGNGVPVTMNFTKYTTVHYPGVFRKSE